MASVPLEVSLLHVRLVTVLLCHSHLRCGCCVQDNMEVRYMNWETDLHRLQSRGISAHPVNSTLKQPEWLRDIPQMEDSATFGIILGSDILYEVCSAAKLSWVLWWCSTAPSSCSTSVHHAPMLGQSALVVNGFGHVLTEGRNVAIFTMPLNMCSATPSPLMTVQAQVGPACTQCFNLWCRRSMQRWWRLL